ncbi:related to SNARE protein of Golgi compartment [Sporisorium reilianum f. sp. reilianum]|uniref:Related to SNARE protein of Golgi compartment n=1 Tax=Sporisorium reilianum f. sp. reilianum TaxID=72559 RepID=A0A2N8UDN0_9BASI|nr:related to SNARE protein of Golgi compartment [Sporisorium reilianum f. sp. reilianum]
MADASASPSWDVLRRKTRNLESTIDARLTSYSQLASKIARSADGSANASAGIYADHTTLDMDGSSSASGSSAQRTKQDANEHVELENELDTLINQLSDAVDALTAKLDDPAVPPTSAQLHAVQRHREVLFDFTRDFRRSKTNVRHAIDRRDLLGNVQGDINAYKAAHASDADALLAERGRIDNSHAMMDRTLEQAYATRSEFADQRSTLEGISTRMTSTAAQVPGLNSIITLIGRRRRRDSIILGCLIGVLTVLLLMFTFR